MCGIVGYVGNRKAVEILLNGLEKLEYRGYDSAGVCIVEDAKKLCVCKEKGKLENLRGLLFENPDNALKGKIGIGHTRWATHGEASRINSHPHLSQNKKFSVVHNGIIENYQELREFLKKSGFKFISETDTEVIVHLVEYFYNGDVFSAFKNAVKMLKGSYALGLLSEYEPDKLFAARKDSPLIVGVGENENFIASDIPAILSETKKVYFLSDGDFCVITKDSVSVSDAFGNEIERELHNITFSQDTAEKGGYEHFMLKEIHEQPRAVLDTLRGRLFDNFETNVFDEDAVKDVNKIYIVACGTAYHAGLVGKYAIEKLSGIPVCVEIASEFRYSEPLLDENTLVIAVSQSGETADTLAGIRLAKEKGSKVFAITNVVGSTVSREADFVFYTQAGPEISVASTKAYLTQLTMLYLFAVRFCEIKSKEEKDTKKTTISEISDTVKRELYNIHKKIEEVFLQEEKIKKIAEKIYNKNDVYYIGRLLDYAVSMEGSLKLKEISYIHSESYAAGELKHGPIALIEKGTPVIAVSTDKKICEKLQSNLKEVATRGAYTIVVCNEDTKDIHKNADELIVLPFETSLLSPLLSVIPLQLLAYYVARKRGNDIDKPKNLAKSVTVE